MEGISHDKTQIAAGHCAAAGDDGGGRFVLLALCARGAAGHAAYHGQGQQAADGSLYSFSHVVLLSQSVQNKHPLDNLFPFHHIIMQTIHTVFLIFS